MIYNFISPVLYKPNPNQNAPCLSPTSSTQSASNFVISNEMIKKFVWLLFGALYGLLLLLVSRVAQLVLRLVTGQTFRDRIPWVARSSLSFQTVPVSHTTPCTTSTGSFLGLKRPGRGVDHTHGRLVPWWNE